MGKEWLYWVGGRGGGGGGGGGRGRSSSGNGRMSGETKDAAYSSAGCMCAVFQLFGLHNFQFPLNQQNPSDFHSNSSFLQEETNATKGLEAPRNSLESGEPAMNSASVSTAMKEEKYINIPAGIQTKTSHAGVSSPRISTSASKSRLNDFSSECSSVDSPGTKTPTLVARLMGLDLLPESSSPSSSKHQTSHLHQTYQRKDGDFLQSRSGRSCFDDDVCLGGARSLPETPRISSARRSDVEYHRLSLQINKEIRNEESAVQARRGRRFRLQAQDENRSPGRYARHIVKQVNDSVSRRVGLDITNTNRSTEHTRRDENLILLEPTKKKFELLSGFDGEIGPGGKQSVIPSYSPRLRCLDPKKNKPITNSGTKTARVSVSSDSHHSQGNINPLTPKTQTVIPFQEQHKQRQQKDGRKAVTTGRKCGSSGLKKLPPQAMDNAIRNKKEEPFVRSTATNKASLTEKKPKKTPLSNGILNTSCPSLSQVRIEASSPLTKLSHKQIEIQPQVSDALSSKRSTKLSGKPSHPYEQLQPRPDKTSIGRENLPPGRTSGCATAHHGGAAFGIRNYVQRILERAGVINEVNRSTLAKWDATSRPIEPSLFYHLELFGSSTMTSAGGGSGTILSHRCNRKLIFQLVDELLVEILKPSFSLMPWVSPFTADDRFPLVDELCKKIDSFPASNCLDLEDIDSLIDKDLRKSLSHEFLEDEGGSIILDIADEIVDRLVRETAEMVDCRTAAEEQTDTDRCHVGASPGVMPLVGFNGTSRDY